MAQGSSAGLSYHRQRAMGMTVHPRGSPAHLIYKLRRVTEDAGTLPAQLDSKELSATHRTKLRNILGKLEVSRRSQAAAFLAERHARRDFNK